MRKFIFAGSYSSALPEVLLLDLFPAEVAFSLRKLSTTTNYVIRVRRDSDNSELDFTANEITDGTLISWVGANNGFIVTIYNQGTGGSFYNANQPIQANQTKFVIAGVVEMTNFKPTMWFERDTSCAPISFADFSTKTIFTVARVREAHVVNYILGNESPINGVFYNGQSPIEGIGVFDDANVGTLNGKDLNQHLAYVSMRSSRVYLAKDGASEIDSGTFANSMLMNKIGGRIASAQTWFNGDVQEVLLYTGDESANRELIEANINTYYSIY